MANSVETRHGKAGAKHGEQRGDQTLKGGSDSQQSRDQTTGMGIEKSASGVLPPAENEFGLFWKPVVASQCTEIVKNFFLFLPWTSEPTFRNFLHHTCNKFLKLPTYNQTAKVTKFINFLWNTLKSM